MKHRTNNAHGRLTQEVAHELKDHKQSFLVFSILRFLVIVVLVRQIMLQSYQSAFLCILTLLLLYVPSWIQIKLRIELPQPMEITVLCFIFAAEILGEVNAFYVVIPGWDTVLHTINGFLAAAVGFSLVLLLTMGDFLPAIVIGMPVVLWNLAVSAGVFALCRNNLENVELTNSL